LDSRELTFRLEVCWSEQLHLLFIWISFAAVLINPLKIALFVLNILGMSSNAYTQGDEPALFTEEDASFTNGTLPHAGGATEEEMYSQPLFNEKPTELELKTLRDSLMNIPAYDVYCNWDTRNLFHGKVDQSAMGSGLNFDLALSECDFVYPANGDMTSPFGPRWGRMHYGLDIDLEVGDHVMAAFEGMVRISQYHSSYGNVIVVRHNNGLETLYAHLSQRKVVPGDHVEPGDIIGLGGNTGRSYGAHLHFEVRYLGQAFNPREIIDPSSRALINSSFTLLPKHFDYIGVAPEVLAARSGSKAVTKGSVKAKYYTVKKGDTLTSIARRNGTSVNAICKLNRIKQTSTLRLGQRLRLK
jgi:murein DD-endopeptidase MepM/ murein hydrolase activator NlpD